MGISGLLPALKPIQVIKHLSEFAGQTIAVDGYVWLHRSVMTCATELAMGKPTHRYVDYFMQRMRLLRHHNIEPYLVFDGGPLPAKKGTEVQRKKQREEGLSRGNALTAQGKHREARECYAKCVDVTPEMAFQVIKMLRAENIQYVVAPYEADAQLAYLERSGLVSGILTEDSDLLVFGCQNVLFKLDAVANTVVSVSRKDFARVSRPESDISLVGWTDVQFRAMAILSGCDYLPSIPGIGLKTACTLLRKWKTPEQVVRAVLLEGKRTVPRGYMDQFRLADKCFQHQRVYCPKQEKLVYLTNVDSDWDEKAEEYVGCDLDPIMAKKLAEGDVDPVSLSPIKDINPGFVPRVRSSASASKGGNQRDKGTKRKGLGTPKEGGILSFFGPNPIIPPSEKAPSSTPPCPQKSFAGKASGKRTLAEVMDCDIIAQKQKRMSKFFEPSLKCNQRECPPNAPSGPSRMSGDKENERLIAEDGEDVSSTLSIHAEIDQDEILEFDVADPAIKGCVEQEDGYISPSSSFSGDLQDLSSPAQPRKTPIRNRPLLDFEFGAEIVSSPPFGQDECIFRLSKSLQRTRSFELPRFDPPGPGGLSLDSVGPDLRGSFADQLSDIDCSENEHGERYETVLKSSQTPSPSPVTPPGEALHSGDLDVFEYALEDPEDALALQNKLRHQAVADGWKKRWALGHSTRHRGDMAPGTLSRRETNVTPAGRHKIPNSEPRLTSEPVFHSATKVTKVMKLEGKSSRIESRKSLPLFEPIKQKRPRGVEVIDLSANPSEEEVESFRQLERFR